MNLEQFHHGIRAAREVLRHHGASGALVIMGSQSILASYSTMVLDQELVDGISIETSVLPQGWIDRLIPEVDPSSGATGWCLDPHDLAVAKLIAGRPKDIDFVDILVAQRLVDPAVVREGILAVSDTRATRALERIDALTARGLPDAERARWHANREQSLADRRARTTEPSPAQDLERLGDAGK